MNVRDSTGASAPFTLAIAATFTAEPIEPTLAFWSRELAMPTPVVFAPYNQSFQQLLDPGSLLRTNGYGLNVILLRLQDWAAATAGSAPAAPLGDGAVQDFARALRAAAARSPVPYLVCVCPDPPSVAADTASGAARRRAESLLTSLLLGAAGVQVVTLEELAATYPVEDYADRRAEALAGVPYRPEYYAALGTFIARRLFALRRPPSKLLALDCDGALWDGVCGEDGPLGVRIDAVRTAVQAFMVRQHDAGMLLALCSKNNEADVAEVFAGHPDMVLRREHFVAWRVNWRPKSANIRELAGELQLALESVVFLDDDPRECAEVQAGCPEVLALPLPPDPADVPRFLQHLWALDQLPPTDEAGKRTAHYRENLQREQAREEAPTLGAFLATLGLEIGIGPMRPGEARRASELTQRTTQFNMTGVRRSEAELRQLAGSGDTTCLSVHVRDRFGDYGLVGLLIFTTAPGALAVDTFLLSCRALGRGVEHRMLAALGEAARAGALADVVVPCVPSERNAPALEFLEETGAAFKERAPGGLRFRFPSTVAARVRLLPADEAPPRTPAGEPPRTVEAAHGASQVRARAALLRSIATELADAEAIARAVAAQPRAQAAVASAGGPEPRTPIERQVAAVFAAMLGVDEVGIHDDFFARGGHSLLAMQALARLGEAFGVELSPSLLFGGAATVAGLAEAVVEQLLEQAPPAEVEAMRAEVEALSEAEVTAMLREESDRGRPRSPESRESP